MSAYYNEIDPYAAQWLRNLIAAGHIADGVVDERSIQDVTPGDLAGFTQCHFFAGIGVWSLALRRAGWPDERPVWTGSCPCQPFSAAGAGSGFADVRHLWPDFTWLIDQRRPAVLFGEQVASKAADPWIDLVQADLEAMGYAFGAVAFPSAGVGAPHIRDRTYWVAAQPDSGIGRLGHTGGPRLDKCIGISGVPCRASGSESRQATQRTSFHVGGLAHAERRNAAEPQGQRARPGNPEGTRSPDQPQGCCALLGPRPAGPVNSLWADADWLFCRDGKWRPVEPGTFPLAHGAPARVGRLRAYGNAINAEAATQFIAAYIDAAVKPF